jgi:prephenate dehydratase
MSTRIRVGFQGHPGAFSEEAAFGALGDAIETVPLDSFAAVFRALEEGELDRAVLPIENSLAGSIHRNYDLLLRHDDVHIVGEYVLRVHHQLLVLPGTRLEEIEVVISHPQALAQCEHYIDELGVERRAMGDTAGSAEMVRREQLRTTAAIASKRAAKAYELEILARGIEDDPENYTRFMILGPDPERPPADVPAKTSIVFSLKDEPSVLFKALSVFALRDIDLTKIESRPVRGRRWKYLFYLDFSASVDDQAARNALRHLEEIATYLRVLGSYPAG